jgi:hypothetical protein
MENKPQQTLTLDDSYFVRVKHSHTYIHHRYRKFILKPTIRGACIFESSMADDFIQSEGDYPMEKVPVKDALQAK